MEITEGYRRARRPTATLCAIGIGWSTAQFELDSLSLGPLGTINLSNASVPIVLALGVLYFMVRCTLEFAMQPLEVRRWSLARADYIITLRLVQSTLLLLATGSLYRSIEVFAYAVLGAIALLAASLILFLVLLFGMTPVMMFIRQRQGRCSVAARILEAEGWSLLMVVIAQITLFAALAVASVKYPPIVTFWPIPPSVAAVTIFGVLASVVVLSRYAELFWRSKLFAHEPPYTEERLPDGTIGIPFGKKTGKE